MPIPSTWLLTDRKTGEGRARPSPLINFETLGLEVKSEHQLDQTATWIVGGRGVLISRSVTTEEAGTQGSAAVRVAAGGADQEVDVVERIRGLSAHFQIQALQLKTGRTHPANIHQALIFDLGFVAGIQVKQTPGRWESVA